MKRKVFMEKFHEKLKELRKEKGFTQQEVADICGVKQTVYAKWENAKMKPIYENLSMLACIFDVSIDYLLSEYIEISKDKLLKLKTEGEKMKVFPQRLKEARQNKQLTQNSLSNMLNISQGAYANWENGKREPNFETLLKLASILKTTTSYLLGEKNEFDC